MASTLQICLLVAVALFAFVQMGEGLTCVACVAGCATNTTQTCSGDNNLCLKIEDGKGDNVIIRACGTKAQCDIYKNCYSCSDKDNCNSSSSLMPSFLVIGIVGTIMAKYYM